MKGAETHGMAQRGGSVETHIRINGQYGPLIVPGTADLLISFDLLEALRYPTTSKPAKMVVNRHMVLPTSVFTQKSPAPTEDEIIAQTCAVRTLPDRCRPDCRRSWQQSLPRMW